MEIVVDTSVLLAILLNEPAKRIAVAKAKGQKLLAPAAVDFEVANAFSAMLRRKRLGKEMAIVALHDFGRIPIQRRELNLASILDIADDLDIYAYDACFLECARRFNKPLMSLDQSLLCHAENMNIKTIRIS